jgi:phytoene desaturase
MASICVVGGGVAGMAVAARLAAKRHEVTLLEKSDRLGGQVHTVHKDGLAFDIGPTLLTLPAVYRDLFLKTGRPLEDEVKLEEQEPGYRYQFSDGSTLQLPGGSSGRTAAAVTEQLGSEAGDQWRAMTQLAGDVWKRQRQATLTEPIRNRSQVTDSVGGRGALFKPSTRRSLDATARYLFSDPRLIQVVNRYASVVGADPRKVPGSLVIWPFVEQTFGLWRVAGGTGALVKALARRCESLGVHIETTTDVAFITTDGAGATGVRDQDGRTYPADIVVSDVAANLLYSRMLTDGRVRRDSRRLRRQTQSFSRFVMMLGVQGSTPAVSDHNVWFPAKPWAQFRDLARGAPAEEPTIYANRHDDASMAPDGHESWVIQVDAPRHGNSRSESSWTASSASAYAQHLLDVIAERGPDLRDRVVLQSAMSPAHFAATTGAPGGALSGTVLQDPLAVLDRPGNISPIPGLFLVGGTTHPGPGLPFAGLSAEIVAESIGRAQ